MRGDRDGSSGGLWGMCECWGRGSLARLCRMSCRARCLLPPATACAPCHPSAQLHRALQQRGRAGGLCRRRSTVRQGCAAGLWKPQHGRLGHRSPAPLHVFGGRWRARAGTQQWAAGVVMGVVRARGQGHVLGSCGGRGRDRVAAATQSTCTGTRQTLTCLSWPTCTCREHTLGLPLGAYVAWSTAGSDALELELGALRDEGAREAAVCAYRDGALSHATLMSAVRAA
jgi:hypothetical protein